MATKKQIKANRRNAKKSTGPKTNQGKKKSSLNALQHGLCAETMLIPHESPDELNDFQQAMHEDLKPQGALEKALVQRIISALWRLTRTDRAEAGLFQIQFLNLPDMPEVIDTILTNRMAMVFTNDYNRNHAVDKLRRYQTAMENGMYKALNKLHTLQAARKAKEESENLKPQAKGHKPKQVFIIHKRITDPDLETIMKKGNGETDTCHSELREESPTATKSLEKSKGNSDAPSQLASFRKTGLETNQQGERPAPPESPGKPS